MEPNSDVFIIAEDTQATFGNYLHQEECLTVIEMGMRG